MDGILLFESLLNSSPYQLFEVQIENTFSSGLSLISFLEIGLEDRAPDAKAV